MRKYLCTLSLFSTLLFALPQSPAKAEDVVVGDTEDVNAPFASVTLVWDSNSEQDLAGYHVYYGRMSGDYTRVVTVSDPTAVIGIRGTQTYYFAVTAFTRNGAESDLSDEVHWP